MAKSAGPSLSSARAVGPTTSRQVDEYRLVVFSKNGLFLRVIGSEIVSEGLVEADAKGGWKTTGYKGRRNRGSLARKRNPIVQHSLDFVRS